MGIPPVGEQFVGLGDHVYEVLLQAIIQRQLRPGDRLVFDDLAARLRVSRTPVRDALNRLTMEGLIEPTGRRGFRVASLSTEDLRQLYDLRLMYERHAVEVGMANVNTPFLARLEALAADIAESSSWDTTRQRLQFSQSDRALHRLVVDLARNPRLTQLYERLSTHIHAIRLGPGPLTPVERTQVHSEEHQAIIAALAARDTAGVRAALSRHICNARDRAMAALVLGRQGEPATARPDPVTSATSLQEAEEWKSELV